MRNHGRSKVILGVMVMAIILSLFSWMPAATPVAQAQVVPNPTTCRLDVVLVLDRTNSMSGAIEDLKTGIGDFIGELEDAEDVEIDSQIGLVTFDDTIQVVSDLGRGNADTIVSSIEDLEVLDPNAAFPEASDEALNTVINGLNASDRPDGEQTGDFNGVWRDNTNKVIVLVTDAEPGGFDNVHDDSDVAHAHEMALAAAEKGIKIFPVFVPTEHAAPEITRPIMEDYATTTGGKFAQTDPDGSGTLVGLEDVLTMCDAPDPCYDGETVTAPFVLGTNGITTFKSYSGPLIITVSGTGQAAGERFSDAFYLLNPEEAATEEHGLTINGQPATNLIPGQVRPAYNKHHTYTFQIVAPGGRLSFGVGDGFTADNSGSYNIVVCAPEPPTGRFDVWMKDHPQDNGTEPHSLRVYSSPDITACHGPDKCAKHVNLISGYRGNYIFVNLRNNGPNTILPPPDSQGSLYLYYSGAGGASRWIPGAPDEGNIGAWHLIGAQHNIQIPADESGRIVRFHWAPENMPATGHYCLLARWVSDGDPMTYPEGTQTVLNAQKNNNIAWKNFNVVNPPPGFVMPVTYRVRPVADGASTTVVIKPSRPFPGTIRANLGIMGRTVALPRMMMARANNAPEVPEVPEVPAPGVVIPPTGGELADLTPPFEGADLTLTFAIDENAAPGPVQVDVVQMAELPGFDGLQEVGGVTYQFNILRPDEPPEPPVAIAWLIEEGAELTWPHALHHTEYEVWRSSERGFAPGDDGATLLATVTPEADNYGTAALRYVDTEVTSREANVYYIVRSKNETGLEADSALVPMARLPEGVHFDDNTPPPADEETPTPPPADEETPTPPPADDGNNGDAPDPATEVTTSCDAPVSTDPQTGQVTIGQARSSRVGHECDVTLQTALTCPAGATPTNAQLHMQRDEYGRNNTTYALEAMEAGSQMYQATIPDGDLPELHGSKSETYPLRATWECAGEPQEKEIGQVILYDPSGLITDAATGEPVDATVTLFRVPGWRPASGPGDTGAGICESHRSKDADAPWSQPAPVDLGMFVDPQQDDASMLMSPLLNPQQTHKGYYGWDVAEGCWYVEVQAEGYASKVSPVVGVPPAVTDLHLTLEPLDSPDESGTQSPDPGKSEPNKPVNTTDTRIYLPVLLGS